MSAAGKRIGLSGAVAVFAVLSLRAAAAQPAPKLINHVEADFLGQVVFPRVTVASFIRDRDLQGRVITRLVDTEVYPSGEIQYLVRVGNVEAYGNLFARSYRTSLGLVTQTYPAGTRMPVAKVEVMDDRVELWLQPPGELHYGKLKFMFGKGFQKTSSTDAVMTFIGRNAPTLRMATLERLASGFGELSARVTSLRTPAVGETTAVAKLERLTTLRSVLNLVVQNRMEYAAASRTATATAQYEAQIAEVDGQLAGLSEAVKKEEQQTLRTNFASLSENSRELRIKAGAQPARNIGEWTQQADALAQWEANLRERLSLRGKAAASSTPLDAFDPDGESRAIELRRKALAQDRQQLELLQINSDFKDMERRKTTLLDAYPRAFGTSTQRDAAAKLIDHLRAMQVNRNAAQKAGSAAAAAQIAQLAREIERIRR